MPNTNLSLAGNYTASTVQNPNTNGLNTSGNYQQPAITPYDRRIVPYRTPGQLLSDLTPQSHASTQIPASGPGPQYQNNTLAPQGDSELQQLQKISNPDPTQISRIQQLSAQQGPSQDEINNQINDAYSANNGVFDQMNTQANTDLATNQQGINANYDTNTGTLNTQHTSDVNQIGQTKQTVDYAHESALAAARRLYSELRQSYANRFGSQGAGDYANELANVEQQRQTGQLNQSYGQTQGTIGNKLTDINNQYQSSINNLNTQKQTALAQAQSDFQNKLLNITQSKAMNETAKAQAKLQALQDLRNQVYATNQQIAQNAFSLQSMQQQSALQLQNYQALAGQGISASGLAAQNLYAPTQATSNLTVSGQQGYSGQPQLTGAINTKKDQYGNPIK